MKYLLVGMAFLFSVAISSCKDDDVATECCLGGYYGSDSTFYLSIPSAYTPNGDGVNDDLIFFTDDFVAEINDITIKNSSGDVVKTLDSLTLNNKGEGINYVWDFMDGSGALVNDRCTISFEVIDGFSTAHQRQVEICSKACEDISDKTKCTYPDQYDPTQQEYSKPTIDTGCK